MKKIFNKIQYWVILGGSFLPLGFAMSAPSGDPIETKVTLKNPIKAKSFEELVEAILEIVVTIGTPIAILAIIYCGFLFVSAQGKPEKLKDARTALIWTIVGVAVLLGARLLATVISGTIKNLGTGV